MRAYAFLPFAKSQERMPLPKPRTTAFGSSCFAWPRTTRAAAFACQARSTVRSVYGSEYTVAERVTERDVLSLIETQHTSSLLLLYQVATHALPLTKHATNQLNMPLSN